MNPYEPVSIFDDGHPFAIAQPQSATSGLLESLRDMVDRGLVPTGRRAAVIESACAIWSKVPERAVETIAGGFDELTPEQAATLASPIDWSNSEQQSQLLRAWSCVAKAHDTGQRAKTIRLILSKGPLGPRDEPDRALRLWLDALGEDLQAVLQETIVAADLADAHRHRLWTQATLRSDVLAPDFLLAVIPEIAASKDIPATADALFEDYGRVSEVLGSDDNRAELAKRLMQAFTRAATKTVKARIAECCGKLTGDASLPHLDAEELTDDDMTILKSSFSGSRTLRKFEKKRSP